MFGSKRKSKAVPSPRPRPLGSGRSFVEVIADARAEKGRLTLTADSDGRSFVILVDNGALCNASGAGLTGRDALRSAAMLTQGSYLVEAGWPVAQPVYQVGLDVALEELMSGTVRPAPELPQPRGVDTLRNQMDQAVAKPVDPPQAVAAPLPVQAPAATLDDRFDIESLRSPVQAMAAPPSQVAVPAALAPLPLPAPPAAVPPPVTFERPTPMPAAEDPQGIYPGDMDASRKQGSMKHAVTQSLLWLVQMEEEPERYTLPQAWTLTRQSLSAGLEDATAPLRSLLHRNVKSRWDGVKDDWEKSGETAKRKAAKRRDKGHPSDDFLNL